MKKIIYFDCFSGISGDMVLGALLHLGLDPGYLQRELSKLGLTGFALRIGKGTKQGIAGVEVAVDIKGESEDCHHHHHHHHDHSHSHDHNHSHNHDHSHAQHRTFADIRKIILNSGIERGAKEKALNIFHVIAKAEGKVHGKPADQVHFHEVGALDSIVDIVGAAILLDRIGADEVYCSPVTDGSGMIPCQHGMIPVPVCAVVEMARNSGISLVTDEDVKTELVTPTGFGILKGMSAVCGGIPKGEIKRVGYGFGKRETGKLNALRVMLLMSDEKEVFVDGVAKGDSVCVVESNLDDISSEVLGYTLDQLFSMGALDVYFTPIFMKKNRPAFKLSVLCNAEDRDRFAALILKETTAFGVRYHSVGRAVLDRHIRRVNTPLGPVDVKVGTGAGWSKTAPEYESCRALSENTGTPLREIYDMVNRYTGR